MKKEIIDKITEYIKTDDRKNLWSLVFDLEDNNLENYIMLIADYFIEKRDSFYVCELISTSIEYLNMDELIDKIVKTQDKDFIEKILLNNTIKVLIEKYYKHLKSECEKL